MNILRNSCRTVFPLIRSLQQIKPVAKLPSFNVFRTELASCKLHTSSVTYHLSEFFDEDNFDALKVEVGRPWRLDELRIKSNEDLHKLWYVLLKERNQIMTMDVMYHEQNNCLPNPERLEKVEESMENLLDVVKERNDAFELFEFGETSDPKTYTIRNAVGIPYKRTATEHYLPKHMNKRYNMMHLNHEPWMDKYLARYEEKFRRRRAKKNKKLREHKKQLVEEFEMSAQAVDRLVEKSTADDELKDYLQNTKDLNDVQRKGR